MKTIQVVLIIGILILPLCLPNSLRGQTTTLIHPSNTDIQSLSHQSQIIIIERIEDGSGLTIYIKNIGDETVHNIILHTEVIEGSPWIVLKKQITIPSLAPGESTDIHMKPFGFSIGMFAPFSMITLSLHAPDIYHLNGGLLP